MNEKRFLELCKEISETCACNGKHGYCFFRDLAFYKFPDTRMLVQLDCIQKFKFEESERQGKDIGISRAALLWTDNGYAKAYAKVYNEDLSVKEIYKRTIEEHKRGK